MAIDRKEIIYLLKKVIPVGIEGEKWIIEVPLQDTVGAIHRAIGDSVDHIVPAADMVGGSRTGLQTPSVKTGDEEMSFPGPDRIGHGRKMFDQRALVLDCFYENIGQGFENGF